MAMNPRLCSLLAAVGAGPARPAARPADWRRLVRVVLPFVVLVAAGVLGVAAVALAAR